MHCYSQCQLWGADCIWHQAGDSEVEWEEPPWVQVEDWEWEEGEEEEEDESDTESVSTTVQALKKLTSLLQLALRILMPKVPEDAGSTVSSETVWEAWLL